MIHTNRIVTVGEQESIIDRPIVLYRGDREVEIEFTLVGNEFTFSEEGNVIKSVNASHGQLVLNTPSGEHMFSELAECHEGKVVFVVTKEMIDEFIEMGFYSFQIRLYDSAEMKSRVTIPPVLSGFDIRNPIAAEDETNVVDQGIVDYARIFKDRSDEELPTFDWQGNYNKTEWAHHDIITQNKMNKIEDALYSINANIKETDVFMLNTLDNVKEDADKYVKEHMAEVEADVEEFERNLNTGVEKFKIDTNAAITAHKEELESVNSQISHLNSNNIRTPQHYGAKGNGSDDDSAALYDAIVDCANNGYVLFLNGKYRVSTNIIYNAWRPVTIIGSRGTYPDLTAENKTRQNESYDIFFDNGATLEINKFGCVTFQNVGFASNSKESGTGIIVKSFRNKFSQCSFSQMEKAIHIMDGSHWVGENQILYCEFVKCGYAIYADDGATSDSEVIGNLIHGSCDVGFYGGCAGFTFSLNHFYNRRSSYFKHFNTKITNNYIQETQDETPSIILNGSFGCIISDNNFELNNADPRTNKMGLIGIELRPGCGNLTITGNAVHGKNISAVQNLAFIDIIYTDTRHDMPIHLDGNNTRCCSAILTKYYPLYNLKGGITLKSLDVTKLGGNISEQTVCVVNGIAHFHVIMDSIPSYANLFKINQYQGIPFQYTMIQTLKDGAKNTITRISTSSTISINNYAQVASVEVVGSYIVAHSSESNYFLE